jgi:ADP-ribose pyrophosphatase YjhB (NUDIX family)
LAARRDRASVIVVRDGRLALIDRVREGSAPYSAVPGGGVEAGESPAEAAVREAKEELGLDVALRSSQPVFLVRRDAGDQHYFLADAVGGTFGTGEGPEFDPARGRGTYAPVLVTQEEAMRRHIEPLPVTEVLLRGFVTGEWPDATVELVDPRDTAPRRVRAGAICVEDGRVLVHRGEWKFGPFYELPGGGVEEGETPEQAVVRELEEEAGLHVRIERELATVWRPGGVNARQHYFLVRPEGASGRATLDLEPGFTQAWLPIGALGDEPVWPKRLAWRVASWHAAGRWPSSPVQLIDSIVDLRPACRW